MAKKGSVTIFFALILSLMMSLICAGMESVRTAAARTQTLCGVDIGLYSLFGQYDKDLLKDYDVFLLDGSCGGGNLKLGQIYDDLESYIKPVLRQNGQRIRIQQGGFTGYRLATDEDGEVFYRQVVQYMNDTLGSQGAQLLISRLQERQRETEKAEQAGEDLRSGKALKDYNSEMDAAARNSQAALEQAEKENGDSEGSGTAVEAPKKKVVNPIPIILKLQRRGILQLVVPFTQEVSENTVRKSSLVSGRTLQTGMPMPGAAEKDSSYVSQILFQQYLMNKLGNYSRPADSGLKYQIEYILCGLPSDLLNLQMIAAQLLVIREGVNFLYLLSDSVKREEVGALALAIASAFLVPPAAGIIEAALLLCWAYGESILDVRELFTGGKVPLVKTAQDWQLTLSNLPNLLSGLDSMRKGKEGGLSYEDYLQILLLSKSKKEKLKRGMDMIETAIRAREERSTFQLDSCIAAMEISVDVKSRRGRTFTCTRQYCYD